jgi:EAL and modified HD-GYP domain-containing signal transduction protein
MSKVYLARQPIKNINGKIFGYELLFRDPKKDYVEFNDDFKSTSQIIVNALTHMDFKNVMGQGTIAFLNANNKFIEQGLLELLDPDKFVIEILQDIEITPQFINKLARLKKKGYRIAIDDFDCSTKMEEKFHSFWKYINVVKVDIKESDPKELSISIEKFKKMGIKLLAQHIDSSEEYHECIRSGFQLFQGNYVGRLETLEYDTFQEATHSIVLKLIKLIKDDKETHKIEDFIKKRPELAYSIIKFINNRLGENEISSITQAITLMGRDKLLRWLITYLYSEVSENHLSEVLLKATLERADEMEAIAPKELKEKAYMTGVFSMLDILFDTDMDKVLSHIKVDASIVQAITEKKGVLGKILSEAENSERVRLKKIFDENFHKIDPVNLIELLEYSGIPVK